MPTELNLDNSPMNHVMLRLVLIQMGCLIIGALVFWLLGMGDRIVAFGYGLVLMSINAAVLAWMVARAAFSQQQAGRKLMHGGAAVRFVALLLLLMLANALGLHLMFVALGMLIAQFALYGVGLGASVAGIRNRGGSSLG